MLKIVGVRCREGGRVRYYNAGSLELAVGTDVIVDTGSGLAFGQVVMPEHIIDENVRALDVTPVVRVAADKDRETRRLIAERETKAMSLCAEKIAAYHLDMKLISCEIMFDNSKIVFYFTSDHRVDFRMLVKELASVFKMRIELRQIGVRDEACLIGGLGICGRPLCCGSFLDGFASVSIKMAKVQNLSLNPTKISGVCGRLMCCLKYEQRHYEAVLHALPKIGKEIDTPEGKGTVVSHNVLKEMISVRFTQGEDSEIKQFSMDDLGIEPVRVPLEDESHSKHKTERPLGKNRQQTDDLDSRLAKQLEEDEHYILETGLDESIGVFSNRPDSISDYIDDAEYIRLIEEEQKDVAQDHGEEALDAASILLQASEETDQPNFTKIQKKNRKPFRHDRKKPAEKPQKQFSEASSKPQLRNAELTAGKNAAPRGETVKPRDTHVDSAPNVKRPQAQFRTEPLQPDKRTAATPEVAPSPAPSSVSSDGRRIPSDNKASSWQEALKRAMSEAKK